MIVCRTTSLSSLHNTSTTFLMIMVGSCCTVHRGKKAEMKKDTHFSSSSLFLLRCLYSSVVSISLYTNDNYRIHRELHNMQLSGLVFQECFDLSSGALCALSSPPFICSALYLGASSSINECQSNFPPCAPGMN